MCLTYPCPTLPARSVILILTQKCLGCSTLYPNPTDPTDLKLGEALCSHLHRVRDAGHLRVLDQSGTLSEDAAVNHKPTHNEETDWEQNQSSARSDPV